MVLLPMIGIILTALGTVLCLVKTIGRIIAACFKQPDQPEMSVESGEETEHLTIDIPTKRES